MKSTLNTSSSYNCLHGTEQPFGRDKPFFLKFEVHIKQLNLEDSIFQKVILEFMVGSVLLIFQERNKVNILLVSIIGPLLLSLYKGHT